MFSGDSMLGQRINMVGNRNRPAGLFDPCKMQGGEDQSNVLSEFFKLNSVSTSYILLAGTAQRALTLYCVQK